MPTPGRPPARPFDEGVGNWWYSTDTGEITHATGLQQIINVDGPGIGLHGPFPTQADAQGYKNAHPPTGPAKVISGAVSGAEALPKFLAALASRQLWVRIAKVGIGAALVIVGVAKLTGNAGALPKVIPI